MHFLNGKLMLSEGWKCYFRDPIFQNLPGEHAPGPPLAARALGTRDWPPINLTFLRHCSFWYPAESQGYMWTFLIGEFLTGFLHNSQLAQSLHVHDSRVQVRHINRRKLAKSIKKPFKVNNERAVRTWKPSSWTTTKKKCFERIILLKARMCFCVCQLV